MGQSTDGILFFGWILEEGAELPWEEYCEEEWWQKTKGYKPPYELYNADGSDYLPGVTQDMVPKYYEDQRNWMKENPMPFETVNYCSGEYPMWGIAIVESVNTAHRGYPVGINLNELKDLEETFADKVKKIQDLLDLDTMPKWHLVSYWG